MYNYILAQILKIERLIKLPSYLYISIIITKYKQKVKQWEYNNYVFSDS